MRTTARQSEMQRATDAYRQRVLAMEQQATLILSATYQDALNELEPRIIALSKQIEEARANGEEPGISWLFQQERYQELRRQLLTLIDQYGQVTKVVTTEAQKLAVREALTYAGNVLLPVSGGDGSELATLARGWASVPDSSIIELVGSLQDGTPLDATIRSYAPDAVKDVNAALTRGLALGDSAQMTTRVLESLGITRTRAESIMRTETMRAARAATTAAYIQSGVVEKVRWSAAISERTCAYCLSRHGKLFPVDYVMESHPNCFPAGTLCSGPEVVGSSVRWYVGDLVDIRFASGDQISVTPNHPILTPHGWVAAGLLDEGSSVVRSSLSERELATVYPNYQDGPVLIEQVAESAGGAESVVAMRVPTAPEDFHGDGVGSDVSVIRTNGFLGGRIDSPITEPPLHDEFSWGSVSLPDFSRFGSLTSLLDSGLSSTRSLMGICSECLTLLGGGLRHPSVHAFGAVAGSYPGGYQSLANTGTSDPVRGGQRFLGFSSEVARHHFLNRESVTIGPDHRHLADSEGFTFLESPEQTSFTQHPNEPGGVDVKPLSSDLRVLAGKVSTDRVLEVSIRSFRGHVYNLETKDGYYIANGIIVHNCRCSLSPWSPKWDEPWQSGESWLKEQPLTVQQDILGKLGAADFNAGNLQLSDFERTGFDKDWGPTGHFGGVGHARQVATKAGRAPKQWAELAPRQATDPPEMKWARQLYEKASKAEPQTTRDLQRISETIDGELFGLDFRLKTLDSTARKIATDAKAPGVTVEDAAKGIKDNLRYTYQLDPKNYGKSVQQVTAAMKDAGYTPVRFKNFWSKDEGYAGINTVWKTANGQYVEVQFNTADALYVKETLSHPLYERLRVLDDDSPEAVAIQSEISQLWAGVRKSPPSFGGLTDAERLYG